nr:btb/poz domain-containing protein 1 [Quercus suber]
MLQPGCFHFSRLRQLVIAVLSHTCIVGSWLLTTAMHVNEPVLDRRMSTGPIGAHPDVLLLPNVPAGPSMGPIPPRLDYQNRFRGNILSSLPKQGIERRAVIAAPLTLPVISANPSRPPPPTTPPKPAPTPPETIISCTIAVARITSQPESLIVNTRQITNERTSSHTSRGVIASSSPSSAFKHALIRITRDHREVRLPKHQGIFPWLFPPLPLMSSHLWKAYYEDDVDAFRQLLEAATHGSRQYTARAGQVGAIIGSPNGLGTSPVLSLKGRKLSGQGLHTAGGPVPTKADVNWRDAAGMTILHHAVTSTAENAFLFASSLIEHPLIDLYVQDHENGWTALHRAFYFGNVSLARFMLERDAGDAVGRITGHVHQTIGLVKVKDKEGHGPLDLYAATIKDRTLRPERFGRQRSGSSESGHDHAGNGFDDGSEGLDRRLVPASNVKGDQLFTFGSNQNVSLGFGDEDDRHFPERVTIRRPEHLVRRFLDEHQERERLKWYTHDPHSQFVTPRMESSGWIEDIPFVIRSKPLIIQDVHMSKLSTAVITADPISNLYMCGHGQGGRLGVGDEQTRFHFTCVESGSLTNERIATVALGQNHTLAISEDGKIFSWGNNGFGQLGYTLARSPLTDEDPISTVPRQIFGPLKRETVLGIAASRVHSVAHTSTSLYTFGKNDGQLGIMDSDARSLDMQVAPRRVAASLFTITILSVAAIDRATVCLLENHDVWVFANYGYLKVPFPLEGFSNYFLKQSFLVTTYDNVPNRITKITGGGDTICALSSRGEIFTLSISQRSDNQASASTTNPSKIRSAITTAQRIWSPRKTNMAARDVAVDADGSVIISTEEGSVWRRTKRAKIKDGTASNIGEYSSKDYKFSRVPGLTRVLAVRGSAYGAYAAIRRDCDVLQTQVVVEDPKIWKDMFSLLSFAHIYSDPSNTDQDDSKPRFWQPSNRHNLDEAMLLKKAILDSKDIEADLADLARRCTSSSARYDAAISTTTSEVVIPVHRFVLMGRSRVLRRGFRDLCETSTFTIADLAVSEIDQNGQTVVKFQGLDILTILNLVLYMYTDGVVDFWHMTRLAPAMAYRFRQTRTELMKTATKLEMSKLEPAVRQMMQPTPSLPLDFEIAFADPSFFYDGDLIIQLEDNEMRVHSALLCARCPFFQGLFMGRADGRWLTGRDMGGEVVIDLKHLTTKTFKLVLRHVYADTGAEIFDDIVSSGLDDFLDVVIDVMSAANELMLDRLSQICQMVMGNYVNVRNVCGLLNAVSASSVHEFKDAGLEYLCLNLEAMLQGHHLNELDEDLLGELDDVVRENQLACMPFAKSGRAERSLHERYPELAAQLERNRQSKIDSISLRSKFHDLSTLLPGTFDDEASTSPLQRRSRRRSSTAIPRSDSDRPPLRPKPSSKDMMFAMDEEDSGLRTPEQSPSIRPMSSPRGLDPIASSPPEEIWYNSRGKVLPSPKLQAQQPGTSGLITPRTPKSPHMTAKTPPHSSTPWNLTPLAGPRTEIKDIMAQATSSRTSSLSQGLAAGSSFPEFAPGSFSLGPARMSQKDRKKMQQAQQSPHGTPSADMTSQSNPVAKPVAWQTVAPQKTATLKDILNQPKAQPVARPPVARSNTPQLTMRQTVANPKPSTSYKPIIGPAGPSSLQQRSVSESKLALDEKVSRPRPTPRPSHNPPPAQSSNSKPIPQSIRHQPPVEQVLGLSMSEIVAQQQLEKDIVKDAMAKRDLQEIQAEQEFQEWWEKESARVQEAEKSQAAAGSGVGPKKQRGRGGYRAGKSGRNKGGPSHAQDQNHSSQTQSKTSA